MCQLAHYHHPNDRVDDKNYFIIITSLFVLYFILKTQIALSVDPTACACVPAHYPLGPMSARQEYSQLRWA